MKQLLYHIFLLSLMILTSCEVRSGYLDYDKQNTVAMLTDVEWLVVNADYGLGNEHIYDDETKIYSFGKDSKGWIATGSLKDMSVKKDVRYFQWSFTTDNYTVICMAGNSTDGYLLIQKLTPTEMWLQWTAKDPVFVPNQNTTLYKFKARKKQ